MDSWAMHQNEDGCSKSGKTFVCVKCELRLEEKVEPREELCNEVEMVNGFCYLGDRISANGGCEAAVTARARIGVGQNSENVESCCTLEKGFH